MSSLVISMSLVVVTGLLFYFITYTMLYITVLSTDTQGILGYDITLDPGGEFNSKAMVPGI